MLPGTSCQELRLKIAIKCQVSQKFIKIILEIFDKIFVENLRNFRTPNKGNIKGKIDNYGHCDGVWKFEIKDCEITSDNIDIYELDMVKIVAEESITFIKILKINNLFLKGKQSNRKNNNKKKKIKT